jgi:hypothetical protein
MLCTKRKIPTEETKPTNQKSANNSDDLQHLLSILGDHPYMQEDIQLKGKPPCIIAYTIMIGAACDVFRIKLLL